MTLDPALAAMLEKARLRPIDWRSGIDQVRHAFWKTSHAMEGEAPALAEIRDLTVQGGEGPLPARLYTPFAAGVVSPGLIYFHGGGFVVGDLESHEMLCRRLADAARVRVLAVAYRLAPEHRFPAAPLDAAASVRWALVHAESLGMDSARIGVAGDSAGGNLAAVTALQLKADGDGRLKAQLLIYPCTQFLRLTPSQIRLKEGFMLTQAAQDFFKERYLSSPEDAADWRVSPLIAEDFKGLPPACVVTAGFDPLLDEGKAYADKLAACGVPVRYRCYDSQLHGFFNMTAISQTARGAIEEAGRWAAETLAA